MLHRLCSIIQSVDVSLWVLRQKILLAVRAFANLHQCVETVSDRAFAPRLVSQQDGIKSRLRFLKHVDSCNANLKETSVGAAAEAAAEAAATAVSAALG